MGLKLTTAPLIEPVSLADIKTHLSIEDTLQDDKITDNIVAARQYCETVTGQALITQTWELAIDGFDDEIELRKKPVQSISAVTYLDTAGEWQTMASTDYGIDDYSPRTWLLPAAGTNWPSTFDAPNSVRVSFVAGYGDAAADVPMQIRQAIILAVGHWVNYQGLAEQGITALMLPRAVDQLLTPYKGMRI